MSQLKPLPPPRALDMSFFSCVPADFKRAGAKRAIVTPVVAEPMAEALEEVMPAKPKGRRRKAALPLDGAK